MWSCFRFQSFKLLFVFEIIGFMVLWCFWSHICRKILFWNDHICLILRRLMSSFLRLCLWWDYQLGILLFLIWVDTMAPKTNYHYSVYMKQVFSFSRFCHLHSKSNLTYVYEHLSSYTFSNQMLISTRSFQS